MTAFSTPSPSQSTGSAAVSATAMESPESLHSLDVVQEALRQLWGHVAVMQCGLSLLRRPKPTTADLRSTHSRLTTLESAGLSSGAYHPEESAFTPTITTSLHGYRTGTFLWNSPQLGGLTPTSSKSKPSKGVVLGTQTELYTPAVSERGGETTQTEIQCTTKMPHPVLSSANVKEGNNAEEGFPQHSLSLFGRTTSSPKIFQGMEASANNEKVQQNNPSEPLKQQRFALNSPRLEATRQENRQSACNEDSHVPTVPSSSSPVMNSTLLQPSFPEKSAVTPTSAPRPLHPRPDCPLQQLYSSSLSPLRRHAIPHFCEISPPSAPAFQHKRSFLTMNSPNSATPRQSMDDFSFSSPPLLPASTNTESPPSTPFASGAASLRPRASLHLPNVCPTATNSVLSLTSHEISSELQKGSSAWSRQKNSQRPSFTEDPKLHTVVAYYFGKAQECLRHQMRVLRCAGCVTTPAERNEMATEASRLLCEVLRTWEQLEPLLPSDRLSDYLGGGRDEEAIDLTRHLLQLVEDVYLFFASESTKNLMEVKWESVNDLANEQHHRTIQMSELFHVSPDVLQTLQDLVYSCQMPYHSIPFKASDEIECMLSTLQFLSPSTELFALDILRLCFEDPRWQCHEWDGKTDAGKSGRTKCALRDCSCSEAAKASEIPSMHVEVPPPYPVTCKWDMPLPRTSEEGLAPDIPFVGAAEVPRERRGKETWTSARKHMEMIPYVVVLMHPVQVFSIPGFQEQPPQLGSTLPHSGEVKLFLEEHQQRRNSHDSSDLMRNTSENFCYCVRSPRSTAACPLPLNLSVDDTTLWTRDSCSIASPHRDNRVSCNATNKGHSRGRSISLPLPARDSPKSLRVETARSSDNTLAAPSALSRVSQEFLKSTTTSPSTVSSSTNHMRHTFASRPAEVYLHRTHPSSATIESANTSAEWLLGLHPLDDLSRFSFFVPSTTAEQLRVHEEQVGTLPWYEEVASALEGHQRDAAVEWLHQHAALTEVSVCGGAGEDLLTAVQRCGRADQVGGIPCTRALLAVLDQNGGSLYGVEAYAWENHGVVNVAGDASALGDLHRVGLRFRYILFRFPTQEKGKEANDTAATDDAPLPHILPEGVLPGETPEIKRKMNGVSPTVKIAYREVVNPTGEDLLSRTERDNLEARRKDIVLAAPDRSLQSSNYKGPRRSNTASLMLSQSATSVIDSVFCKSKTEHPVSKYNSVLAGIVEAPMGSVKLEKRSTEVNFLSRHALVQRLETQCLLTSITLSDTVPSEFHMNDLLLLLVVQQFLHQAEHVKEEDSSVREVQYYTFLNCCENFLVLDLIPKEKVEMPLEGDAGSFSPAELQQTYKEERQKLQSVLRQLKNFYTEKEESHRQLFLNPVSHLFLGEQKPATNKWSDNVLKNSRLQRTSLNHHDLGATDTAGEQKRQGSLALPALGVLTHGRSSASQVHSSHSSRSSSSDSHSTQHTSDVPLPEVWAVQVGTTLEEKSLIHPRWYLTDQLREMLVATGAAVVATACGAATVAFPFITQEKLDLLKEIHILPQPVSAVSDLGIVAVSQMAEDAVTLQHVQQEQESVETEIVSMDVYSGMAKNFREALDKGIHLPSLEELHVGYDKATSDCSAVEHSNISKAPTAVCTTGEAEEVMVVIENSAGDPPSATGTTKLSSAALDDPLHERERLPSTFWGMSTQSAWFPKMSKSLGVSFAKTLEVDSQLKEHCEPTVLLHDKLQATSKADRKKLAQQDNAVEETCPQDTSSGRYSYGNLVKGFTSIVEPLFGERPSLFGLRSLSTPFGMPQKKRASLRPPSSQSHISSVHQLEEMISPCTDAQKFSEETAVDLSCYDLRGFTSLHAESSMSVVDYASLPQKNLEISSNLSASSFQKLESPFLSHLIFHSRPCSRLLQWLISLNNSVTPISSPAQISGFLRYNLEAYDVLIIEWSKRIMTPENLAWLETAIANNFSVPIFYCIIHPISKSGARKLLDPSNDEGTNPFGSQKSASPENSITPQSIPRHCPPLPLDANPLCVLHGTDLQDAVLSNLSVLRGQMRLGRLLKDLRGDHSLLYQITRRIGSGGFGDVYEVSLYASKGKLAMKRIPLGVVTLERMEYLYKEVAIMRELDHRNIVQLSHVNCDKVYLNIFMELCDCTLEEMMKEELQHAIQPSDSLPRQSGQEISKINEMMPFNMQRRSISISELALMPNIGSFSRFTEQTGKQCSRVEATLIIRDVVSAVKYLHAYDIVHRDIKPQNILFLDGIAKLADFGSATTASKSQESLRTMKGTVPYMAPEVFLGESYRTPCDIWSLGILFAELLNLHLAHFSLLHFPALQEFYKNMSRDKDDIMPVVATNFVDTGFKKHFTEEFVQKVVKTLEEAQVCAQEEIPCDPSCTWRSLGACSTTPQSKRLDECFQRSLGNFLPPCGHSRTIYVIEVDIKNLSCNVSQHQLPASLIELLESTFHRNPEKRITAEQLLEHPIANDRGWVNKMFYEVHQLNARVGMEVNENSNSSEFNFSLDESLSFDGDELCSEEQ